MFYKSIINVVGVVAAATVVFTGCEGNSGVDPNPNPTVTKGTFVDSRDGKTYKKVTINTQTWMAENLNYAAEGSKCYEDNPSNCATYGRLYNWDAALTVCPAGFHLPSDDEWTAITDGGDRTSTAGRKLKATSGWTSNGNGTDNYGFSALPGGGRGGSDGGFSYAGTMGTWWSATEIDDNYAPYVRMGWDIAYVYHGSSALRTGLYSVRCVEDN